MNESRSDATALHYLLGHRDAWPLGLVPERDDAQHVVFMATRTQHAVRVLTRPGPSELAPRLSQELIGPAFNVLSPGDRLNVTFTALGEEPTVMHNDRPVVAPNISHHLRRFIYHGRLLGCDMRYVLRLLDALPIEILRTFIDLELPRLRWLKRNAVPPPVSYTRHVRVIVLDGATNLPLDDESTPGTHALSLAITFQGGHRLTPLAAAYFNCLIEIIVNGLAEELDPLTFALPHD